MLTLSPKGKRKEKVREDGEDLMPDAERSHGSRPLSRGIACLLSQDFIIIEVVHWILTLETPFFSCKVTL